MESGLALKKRSLLLGLPHGRQQLENYPRLLGELHPKGLWPLDRLPRDFCAGESASVVVFGGGQSLIVGEVTNLQPAEGGLSFDRTVIARKPRRIKEMVVFSTRC